MDRRLTRLLPPVLILGALFLFAPAYLSRDLWFDEALTFLDFAQRGSPLAIYRSYVIPNNQILYTIALHYWFQLLPPGIEPVFWFRLLSFLFGIATLLLFYRFFRVRMAGGTILLPVLTAMAVSVPFLIYATALRGYMPSALFIVLALHTALNFAGKPEWKRGFWYALASLGAVATIPSNLAVLAGVVLYALPLFGNGFWKRRAFWILALIPPAMFLLFYLPILPSFLGCLRLGEGWHSGWGALLAVLAAFVYSFAMLLLPGTGSLLALDRERFQWIRAMRLLIWLIPLPMALLLKVAPFPRVFFPFWPLWALLLAAGIRDLTALNCRLRRRWNRTVWIGALFAVAVGWGFLAQQPNLRLMFSRRFGGAGADDYFYGYYLRPEHTPSRTAFEIAERFEGRPLAVYASFQADPWPLMFYLNTSGADLRDFRFDGPRGPVKNLERGTLVILRSDESAQQIEQRFHRRLKLLFSNANHGVYTVER
ncbi:hypothetical protein [uncultured Victivallis sp.]|uniref:hypothetical protein n=1 Tax=uncultured Victivallis sp. TaxID=354118 RepID=UPI0025EEF0E9|nr:hypothetical protein [uncultured Victivallis sp.]